MPIDINRPGRGVRKVASATIADGGLDTTGTAILTGVADHIYVAHRAYFQYPTDVTKWDMDFKIDGLNQAGTAYDMFTIDEAGTTGPTDLRAVFDYDVPDPPTGWIYGYIELGGIPLAESDTIKAVGNDATAGNNYTSTGGDAMQITIIYDDIDEDVYYQNVGK
jgi:hypothetical protein